MTARIAIALLALSVGVGEARGDARQQMVRALKKAGCPAGQAKYAETTNYALQSESLDQAPWAPRLASGSVSANAVADPSGALTAERFTSSAADGALEQSYTFTNGQTYTFSVWLRSDTPRNVAIILVTGSASTTTAAVTTAWQRFSVTRTATQPAGRVQIGGGNTLSAGAVVDVSRAQLEIGAAATPYIGPTLAEPVVRAAGCY